MKILYNYENMEARSGYFKEKKAMYHSMVALKGGCRSGKVVELSKVVAELKDLEKF